MLSGNPEQLIQTVRSAVIGRRAMVQGPFGMRPLVYADYTASGRSLDFIESYIRDAVLPLYANTHTEASGTGLQTSRFRDEARQIIKQCLGATDEHALLFCGTGATAAIDKLVGVLGIRIPSSLTDAHKLDTYLSNEDRPVVFVGPYEHHSNELPWRESIADVITIREDDDGHISLIELREQLELHAHRTVKIGSFSAASNVTGILTDTAAVATLLHEYGALSFWDFAAAAPYIKIDMGDPKKGGAYFDAIVLSTHKLIGGPGTPGILLARKELFTNRVPVIPGGGTVSFVTPDDHRYLDDIEHREEGGTPGIVEAIRAGLVFQLKEAVGADEIGLRESAFIDRAIKSWGANPYVHILGNIEATRLSIISFVVESSVGTLHHNLVVAALNDLFGIQSRGGCSCAGPYGHRLLGIETALSKEYRDQIERGCEGIKPGWVRLNFNYFIDEETFAYIVDAVHFVANHGEQLLRFYNFEPLTGLWKHRDVEPVPRMSLKDVSYDSGAFEWPSSEQPVFDGRLADYLTEAESLLADSSGLPAAAKPTPLSEQAEDLRWFPLPSDSKA
jgi:selenocysteine lyase/cysteine desulfurase